MLIQHTGLGTPRFLSAQRETKITSITSSRPDASADLPHTHVRIERHGDEFNASASTDGTDGSWSEINRVTIEGFPRPYLAGLVTIGHDASPFADFTPLAAEVTDLKLVRAGADVGPLLRGDCNDDGGVDISDAVCLLNWLFLGRETLDCVAVTNTNGDEREDISDAIHVLTHLFLGEPAPVSPHPECGPGTLSTDRATCVTPPKRCQQ